VPALSYWLGGSHTGTLHPGWRENGDLSVIY